MKRVYIILFSIYGAYHMGLVAFTFYANSLMTSNDIKSLLGLSKQIPMTRWLALLGLLLLIITILFFLQLNKSHSKKLAEVEAEKNSYKARMYDMMKSDKESTTAPDSGEESTEAGSNEEG